MTFASTITSLFVTVTLLIDYVRTPDFSNSGSGVTRKQRSLIIIVMILLTYLGIGAMAYSFMLDYPFLDALYFCVCSSLTIGFGDISPSTTGSQAFSIFYNTFGILNTGLAIAIARETIVEAFEQTYRERRHALTMRRKAHRELKAKSHLLKHSLWHAGQKINDHAPSPFELPVSDMPPISDSDTTSQKNGKGSGQQEKAKVLQGESEEKQANQKGKQAANRPDLWQKATLASLVSEKDSPTAFIEEEQQATAAIQDQTDKLHDQMKKFDSNMVSGFGDEEKEYVQFRQNIIKEEKKEFRAKVHPLLIRSSSPDRLPSSMSHGVSLERSGFLEASSSCCLRVGHMARLYISVRSLAVHLLWLTAARFYRFLYHWIWRHSTEDWSRSSVLHCMEFAWCRSHDYLHLCPF